MTPTGPDLAGLTARMVQHDEEAYRKFYELYFDRLFRYLLVVTGGDEHQTKEALQQTLLRVVHHIKCFDAEPTFWSWLTVLARSSLIDLSRKKNRYANMLDRFLSAARTEADPAVAARDADWNELMEEALDQLPDMDRSLIEQKYLAGATVRQIANSQRLTEKAIESRLVRARRVLKERILHQLNHEKPNR